MLSKEAISSAVQEILLTADLKTLSSKQVREKLEQRFNVPLMSQREEIDTILMDIIAKKFFSSEEARGLDEIDSSSALSPDASSDNSSCDEASGSDNVSCKASGSNANSIPSDPDESDNLESSDSGSVNDEEDDEEIARRLQLEELGVRKRNVERRLSKSKRPARGEGAAPSSVSPKKRRSAYTQECVLSPELAAVMGTDKDLDDVDAGSYRCAILNQHGRGNANFHLKLTGFSAPSFVEKPKIESKDEGHVLLFEFQCKSKSPPSAEWTKEGVPLAESERIKLAVNQVGENIYHCTMEIQEPRKETDAGQFICTVINESGKLTASFTIKFEVPPGAPTFNKKPQILQQTLDNGDGVIIFDVGFLSEFQPTVIWVNPKEKKMKESNRIKYFVQKEGEPNAYTAQLHLKNYKAKDSGVYLCNIKNEVGEANAELTINIEGPIDEGGDDPSEM